MAQENGHADTPDSRRAVARRGTHIKFVTGGSQFGDKAMTGAGVQTINHDLVRRTAKERPKNSTITMIK